MSVSPPPASTGPSSTGLTIRALGGVAVAAVAVVAAILSLDLPVAIAATLLTSAAVAAYALFKYTQWWGKLASAVLIFVLVVLAGWSWTYQRIWTFTRSVPCCSPSPSPSAAPSASASPQSTVAVAFPPPSPPAHDVPRCFYVRGSGSPPQGMSLIVGHREKGTDRIFFEGGVQSEQGGAGWMAHVSIGDPDEANKPFEIYVVAADTKLVEHLMGTNYPEEDKVTWWASSDEPPGSMRIALLDVVQRPNLPPEC